MKRTTSIFVISMVAIMVSGVARADIASSGYVTEQIATKADKSTVYTKGEIDNKLADKQTVAIVTTVRAVASATDTNYPSEKAVATALDAKQPKGDYATTIALNAVKGTADSAVQPGDLAAVATSGSYNDLTNKPTIPAAQVQSDWNATEGVAAIKNKPTIPTTTSQLTNNSDFATNASVTSKINALDGTSTGTGAVVTGVSQTDGVVTVTKGNVQIPVGGPTGTTYATIWVQ